jgi:nitrogen-specific signal transduction histidine kinase
VEHTLQAVAHEIRNPLLAVGGFARRLAAAVDPATEGGEYVRIILKEASRLEKVLVEMTGQKDKPVKASVDIKRSP